MRTLCNNGDLSEIERFLYNYTKITGFILSILCYAPSSVEIVGPRHIQISNQDPRHPQFS